MKKIVTVMVLFIIGLVFAQHEEQLTNLVTTSDTLADVPHEDTCASCMVTCES